MHMNSWIFTALSFNAKKLGLAWMLNVICKVVRQAKHRQTVSTQTRHRLTISTQQLSYGVKVQSVKFGLVSDFVLVRASHCTAWKKALPSCPAIFNEVTNSTLHTKHDRRRGCRPGTSHSPLVGDQFFRHQCFLRFICLGWSYWEAMVGWCGGGAVLRTFKTLKM